jgi:hypothetical protein
VSKLLKALEQTRTLRKGMPCSVGALLESLPVEERDALKAALADPLRSRTTLSEAVRVAYGVEVQGHTLARHARKQCVCER